MHQDCIAEVQAAIGRILKPGESDAMEARIVANMRDLARTDPNWRSLSGSEKLQAAAELSAAQDIAMANKAAQRKASNLVAQQREVNALRLNSEQKTGSQPVHKTLFERLRQVDSYVNGVRHEMMGNLMDAIHATEPRFLGLLENPHAIRDFTREAMGEKTGNEIAAKGAKAYLDQMEATRLRMNAAGADIGKLDYSWLPQPHDVGSIARAGMEKWVSDIKPKLNTERYIKADGTPMNDAELTDFLGKAWETLSSEGRNKMIPGQSGSAGSRAARFDDAHRAIHFKDAQSHLEYLSEYGRGSMLQAIHGHVNQMAKSIGMMEQLGANPNSTFRLLKDTAEKMDNKSGASESSATLDMVWDTLNGTASSPVDANLAAAFQGIRNFTSAVKLQGVMIGSITDAPLHALAAKYNGMPLGETMSNTLKAFGGNTTEAATRLGLATEAIAGEMQQWHADNLAQGWTSKLANTTMKLTLVEAWTHSLRRGFGLTLSSTLEKMRQTDWADLSTHDLNRMKAAGVLESDWKIWQMAKAEEVNGHSLLTKNGIRDIEGLDDSTKNQATAKLLGFIDQEAHIAVLSPDLMTRASVTQGTRAGTWGGEITRSAMLFKSFLIAIIQKHLRRIESIETAGGKTAYSVAMMTGLTMFGALALQLGDVISGKDPRDMTTPKFWAAAFMKGGGLGIMGDIFYTGMGGQNQGGQPNWTSLMGPVFGTGFDALNVTLGNLGQELQGKKTNAAAEIVRFTKQNTPLINLWYLRAVIDHAFMHDLQETVSPGYLGRMRASLQKDWHQDYWWEPGAKFNDVRSPDFQQAVGK
jgi:hypothetical protein